MSKVTALQRQIKDEMRSQKQADVRNARTLVERQVQATEKQTAEAVKANHLLQKAIWISFAVLLVSIATFVSVWLR